MSKLRAKVEKVDEVELVENEFYDKNSPKIP